MDAKELIEEVHKEINTPESTKSIVGRIFDRLLADGERDGLKIMRRLDPIVNEYSRIYPDDFTDICKE